MGEGAIVCSPASRPCPEPVSLVHVGLVAANTLSWTVWMSSPKPLRRKIGSWWMRVSHTAQLLLKVFLSMLCRSVSGDGVNSVLMMYSMRRVC